MNLYDTYNKSIEYNIELSGLCISMGLGEMIKVEKINGGLLHRIFRIETVKGIYAIKVLNPQIIKRKTAMTNFELSEEISQYALKSGIPALPAIRNNGQALQELNGQYYLVFPWVEGTKLSDKIIDNEKAGIVARLLAKIHQIDFRKTLYVLEPNQKIFCTDWKSYSDMALEQNTPWADTFHKSLHCLYQLEDRANKAISNLMQYQVISHRDLDRKNILWDKQRNPIIIDWEAVGFINPSLELLEAALHWSSNGNGIFDKSVFLNMIYTYLENRNRININYEDVCKAIYCNKLNWLAYNIRRSLGIECSSGEEKLLGSTEVTETLQSIENYRKQLPEIKRLLENS